jgi:transcriptional regulator with XRE-family HTH domain
MARRRTTPLSPEALHLADRVYILRHTKRLTQQELAKAVGCSPSTISGIENRQADSLTLAHLAALARVLETTVDDLLGLQKKDDDEEPAVWRLAG